MDSLEKRKFKRLQITLGLSCRKIGSTAKKPYNGFTVNVSPGGLYFETTDNNFEPGDLLKVELSIPPTAGLLESGGGILGFGKVLRTCSICDSHSDANLHPERYGVALEFCQSLKLCT